eukprot:TRINITY_DN33772_c0_g1_i5.p1 TRINITY_DN33772_c0_g1~~TRINITY_DN33772_c0_g1_i5.p1  ORF type:complete len:172 (+),score=38.17 TRINITY_DN33772_c0_g1_i5:52-567(+)
MSAEIPAAAVRKPEVKLTPLSPVDDSKTLILYGGPYPAFVKIHALAGIVIFAIYMLRPSSVISLFLHEQVALTPHLKLFSQLYGVLGLCICTHLFFEPILTRPGALVHGVLAIAITMILVINRNLIQNQSLYISLYFAVCGIYFVIRAPNAVKVPTSPQKIKRLRSAPKLN